MEADTAHQEIAIDVRTGHPADSTTPEGAIRFETFWVLPYEYREWAEENGVVQPPAAGGATNGNDQRDPVTEGEATAAGGEPISGMTIRLASPDANRVYRLDPRLPPEAQSIAVTAVPGLDLAADDPPVMLYLDGARLAALEGPDYTSWWQLQAGRHTFQAVAIRSGGQIVSSDLVTVQVQ
jgi:hypothetical protein